MGQYDFTAEARRRGEMRASAPQPASTQPNQKWLLEIHATTHLKQLCLRASAAPRRKSFVTARLIIHVRGLSSAGEHSSPKEPVLRYTFASKHYQLQRDQDELRQPLTHHEARVTRHGAVHGHTAKPMAINYIGDTGLY